MLRASRVFSQQGISTRCSGEIIRPLARAAAPMNATANESRSYRWHVLLLVLLISLCMTSCYSMASTRHEVVIFSKESPKALVIHGWVDRGWIVNMGPHRGFTNVVFYQVPQVLLLYPLDIVMSSALAFDAMCNPALDVRWGPLGAAMAIVLPGVTAFPGVYTFTSGGSRLVTHEEMAALIACVEENPDNLGTLLQTICGEWDRVAFVELRDRTREESKRVKELKGPDNER